MIDLVKITDKFSLGKYLVTNAEYKKFVDETDYRKPNYWDDDIFNQPKQPVSGVNWTDATEFCKWANLRLPTETEWEYACRAGTTTKYYFGDDPEQLGDYAWFSDNSNRCTHPVGEKLPNGFGLYDMHGNMWEWCQDWYENGRILCGGSFSNAAEYVRLGCRNWGLPNDHFGFRVARTD
jgi:formylglycine-generating enzyme required for sulfatase activity